jgi:hypothetical protein
MLEEYALRFYTLLEQSIRIDASDWKVMAMVAAYPYMDDSGKQQLMDRFDSMEFDIIEKLREGQISTNKSELKELFGE